MSSAYLCYRISVFLAGFLSSRLLATSRKSTEPDWQEVQRAVSHQHLRYTPTNAADAAFPPDDRLGECHALAMPPVVAAVAVRCVRAAASL